MWFIDGIMLLENNRSGEPNIFKVFPVRLLSVFTPYWETGCEHNRHLHSIVCSVVLMNGTRNKRDYVWVYCLVYVGKSKRLLDLVDLELSLCFSKLPHFYRNIYLFIYLFIDSPTHSFCLFVILFTRSFAPHSSIHSICLFIYLF